MTLSKNRIKQLLKSKNKKQTKKNIKKKKKYKNHNSFRKKRKNLRTQTIKNVKKHRPAKKRRKAYIHKIGHNKISIMDNIKNNFSHRNKLNKYILPVIYEEYESDNALMQFGGGNEDVVAVVEGKSGDEDNTGNEGEGGNTGGESSNTGGETGKEGEGKSGDTGGDSYGETGDDDTGKDKKKPENSPITSDNNNSNNFKEGTPDAAGEIGKRVKEKGDLYTVDGLESNSFYSGTIGGSMVGGGKESKKGGGEEGNEESKEQGDEEDNSESNFSPEEQQIKPFFEIGFLFNASEGLNIKLLSDDDVGKTTENAAEEEQENEDKWIKNVVKQ